MALKLLMAGLTSLSAFLLATPAPPARTGPVAAEEWPTLLAQARRTGVIELGDRPVVDLPRTLCPSTPLVIRGGRFGPVELDRWCNVTFDGGRFSAKQSASEYQYLLVAYDAENLTIRNAHFSGYETPEGELRVRGPSIRGGRNVTIERSTIEHLAGFTNFIRTDGGRFADNDLRDMREGLEIQGARNLVIERNRFENFRPFNGDHADAVQIFTTGLTQPGDTGSRDIVIRDNLMLLGSKAQGVFAGDEIGLGGTGKGYARFTIENNIIVGAGWHGITVAYADGLIVRENRLGRVEGSDLYDSRIDVTGTGVVVEGNEANAFIFRSPVKEARNAKFGPLPAKAIDQVVNDWLRRFRPS